MMDDPNHKWQCIIDRTEDVTERLKVPGGWLYRTQLWQVDTPASITVALAFVPEPASWSERS
jgi:hypothetical protein